MDLRNFFQTIHWALLQSSYQGNWIWMVNGRLQIQKFPTHQCIKTLRRENLSFLAGNFENHQNSFTWNLVFSLPLRILLKPWTFSFKKDTITRKTVSKSKCLEKRKTLRLTLQTKRSGLAFFSTDLGHIFGSNVGIELGLMLRGKGPHKQDFAHDIVRIHSLMMYTDPIDCNIVGDTKVHCCVAFSLFRSSSQETL